MHCPAAAKLRLRLNSFFVLDWARDLICGAPRVNRQIQIAESLHARTTQIYPDDKIWCGWHCLQWKIIGMSQHVSSIIMNDVWKRKVTAEDWGITLEEQLSSLAPGLRCNSALKRPRRAFPFFFFLSYIFIHSHSFVWSEETWHTANICKATKNKHVISAQRRWWQRVTAFIPSDKSCSSSHSFGSYRAVSGQTEWLASGGDGLELRISSVAYLNASQTC